MNTEISCLLVLLNKNEEVGLEFLIPKLKIDNFSEVICIDGNSQDRSLEILMNFNIKVLPQKSTGRGEAFKIAFDYSKNKDFDYLLFFSTDGNEDPIDLDRFLYVMSLKPDLIIASRMLAGSFNEEDSHLWKPRKWGNKFFSIMAWLFFSRNFSHYISDPINGFRAFRFSSWSNNSLKSSNFSIEYETSILAYKNRFKVLEFPTHEFPRLAGVSGAKAFRTSLDLTKVLLRNLLK
jgi:glycosyltransferase involved in cell wall biosynthesis